MLVVQPATATDRPRLVALDTVAAHQEARSGQIARWIDGSHCHILEQDGEALGYAVLTTHFFDRPFIEMVMIAADRRGQGLGSVLVGHLIDLSPAPEIWTSTNQSNTAMHRLLAAHGFARRGWIDLDAGDPELVFCRAKAAKTTIQDPPFV